MKKYLKPSLAAAFAASLAVSMTACSSTPAENEADACGAYTGFVEAVAGADATIDGSSSVGEIREAREKIATAYDELDGKLGEVSADRKQALADSWKDLSKAIEDVNEDQDLPEAKASITEQIDAVKAAHASANTDLNC